MKKIRSLGLLAIAALSFSGCFDPALSTTSSTAEEKDGKNELVTAAQYNGPTCRWLGVHELTTVAGGINVLRTGECIYSPDQLSQLMLRETGYLELHDNVTGRLLWRRGGQGANLALMQDDGNFVLYKKGVGPNGVPTQSAIWSTQTSFGPYTSLTLVDRKLYMIKDNTVKSIIYFPGCSFPYCRFP